MAGGINKLFLVTETVENRVVRRFLDTKPIIYTIVLALGDHDQKQTNIK